MSRLLAILSVCATLISAFGAESEDLAFFESKIRPVLVEHCYECHSQSAGKEKGGLMVDTRDALRKGGATGSGVTPGDLDQSLIIAAIRYDNQDLRMPPKHRLPDTVVADFMAWVKMGAPDPREGSSKPPTQIAAKDHWAYQLPQAAEMPAVSQPLWPDDRIDHLILAGLDAKGLKPNPDADRVTLIRRATLELSGLPPTPEEIAAFLNDPAPDREAFTRVVDRLLAADSFGVRWGRHWLDVARYAESSGYDRNMTYPMAWKYRNWVIQAFNNDLPYDEFVRLQIAGDLLPAVTTEQKDDQILATAFLTIGPKTLNENAILQFDLNVADEQIDATCRAFLALTANCARCHDHKYDPIQAKDYYAMAGIFRSSKNLAIVATNVRNEHIGGYPIGPDAWARLQAYEAYEKMRSEQQALYLTMVKARDSYKKHLEEEKQKLKDDPDYMEAERIVQAQQTHLKNLQEGIPPIPETVMAVSDAEKMVNSPLYDRGNAQKPLAEVPRGTLSVFGYESPAIGSGESGRRQLAEWMVDARNPLTSRVFVNRVWHHLFGTGLVESVDNFGAVGDPPVNQALLDDLAVRFVEDGWSIKRLIRAIMLSRAYRLSSAHQENAYAIDPAARLNWRFPPQALEGEVLRDSLLALGGTLDPVMLEGSQIGDLSLKFTNILGREIGRKDFIVKDIHDAVSYRSVYLPSARAATLEVMAAFDQADPNLVFGQRRLTVLPKQALYLMNSPLALESAERVAKSLLGSPGDASVRAGQAFRRILGREPTAGERRAIVDYASASPDDEQATWSQICQSLFCTGEFRTVY